MGTFIIIVIIAITLYSLQRDKEKKENYTQKVRKAIQSKPFKSTHEITLMPAGNDIQAFLHDRVVGKLAINTETKEIFILNVRACNKSDVDMRYSIRNFKDLIEVKVNKDSDTVTSSSLSVGGAIAGGILAGGVGAIIGGMSGSTTSYKDVDSLTLELVFNDLDNPTEKIEFHTYSKLNMEESDWKEALKLINEWYRRMEVIAHRNMERGV